MIYGFFNIVLFIILIEVLIFDILKLKNSSYRSYFNITWVFLSLVSICRYGVGVDTPNYMEAFSYIPQIWDLKFSDLGNFRFSLLYLLINSLSKSIYNDFLLLQIFQGIAFFSSLYWVFKSLYLRRFFILLFFYLFLYLTESMSALRECFAMSFCFIALVYYDRNNLFLYFIFVLIAIGFHSGAIVFFLLPLSRIAAEYNEKGFYLVIVVPIILYGILSIVSLKFLQGLFVFGDNAIYRYMDNTIESFSYTNLLRNIFTIAIIKFFLIDNPRLIRKDYALLGVLGCLLDIGAGGLPIIYRAASYFQIFMYYCFCRLILMRNVNKLMKLCIIILFLFQPVSRYFSLMNSDGLDPYCSVFSSNNSLYKNKIKNAKARDYLLH